MNRGPNVADSPSLPNSLKWCLLRRSENIFLGVLKYESVQITQLKPQVPVVFYLYDGKNSPVCRAQQLLLFSGCLQPLAKDWQTCMHRHTHCHGDLPSVLSHCGFPQPKIKACYAVPFAQENITQECLFAYEHCNLHRSILKPFTLLFTA